MSSRKCEHCGDPAKYECVACDGKAAYCCEAHQKIDYDERHHAECNIEGLSLRKFNPFVSDFQHALPDLFVAISKLRASRGSASQQKSVMKHKVHLLDSMKKAHMFNEDSWKIISDNVDNMHRADDEKLMDYASAIFHALLNAMRPGHPGYDQLSKNLENDSLGMSTAMKRRDEKSIKLIAKNWGVWMDRRQH
jgi:hypothetical protein